MAESQAYFQPEMGDCKVSQASPKELSVVMLEGINIKPGKNRAPVLNLKQNIFIPQFSKQSQQICTQTSATKLKRAVSSSCSSTDSKKQYFEPKSRKEQNKPVTPVFKCRRSRPLSRPGGSKIPVRIDENNVQMIDASECTKNLEEIVEDLYEGFWETHLHALKGLTNIAHLINWKNEDGALTMINRRLIDLLKSPRSMIIRVVCETCGDLFKATRCTKRPEFDELVTVLLSKTADTNRFIQRDANIALDKMVTFISLFHSVRVLSLHGPHHKSPAVRVATARLFVCISALAGPEAILGNNANNHTRKRMLSNLAKFLCDKCADVRRFGERMYQILRNHKFFSDYFFKDMEFSAKLQFKKIFLGLEG